MSSALRRLEQVLREQGGLIAGLVGPELGGGVGSELGGAGSELGGAGPELADGAPAAGSAPSPAPLAAQGPRAAADRDEYELLVEAIYEGYLLHYGAPRVVRPPEADLALLAGDQLYALGLARLVRLGDIDAVAELADVITLCALAHGSAAPELAQAVWAAGAKAIGWGGSEAYEKAKALAREGSSEALPAMRLAAAL